ncbi:MAG: DNA-binding response regulator [Bacteroidetes bacterium GWF2_43_63]|nr:MAG: DNA-binding response regulator [Bacteroidetes bacterium GWE2_42_42]OFY52961.1 MAG: DNA-binding response regulator [Bacteroidetes bacterium GWF2_43_63]HBG70171.1 DNA-binding response regulator [Bacteroidales bacterium]HCB62222.1 DNA-binding response regulator [Bacteroidales bacterium]
MNQNENIRILLVDDEKDILEIMSYNLKKEGYNVFTARDGQSAITKALDIEPQLIVLDIMMPGMDGITACQEMRKHDTLKKSVIIFLTARNEDFAQIAALESGGDDFISKPITPKVFLTKVKTYLRRFSTESSTGSSRELEFEGLTINFERYIVIREGQEILLPRKEFELLALLASKPGKVFTREEIFSKVWGNDIVVGDRTIDVHIRKIREKIGLSLIRTVKGVGYTFEIKK